MATPEAKGRAPRRWEEGIEANGAPLRCGGSGGGPAPALAFSSLPFCPCQPPSAALHGGAMAAAGRGGVLWQQAASWLRAARAAAAAPSGARAGKGRPGAGGRGGMGGCGGMGGVLEACGL